MSAGFSVIFYVTPMWKGALRYALSVESSWARLQSKMTLRSVRSYRTVGTDAMVVLANFPPVDLLVEEWSNKMAVIPSRDVRKKHWTYGKQDG